MDVDGHCKGYESQQGHNASFVVLRPFDGIFWITGWIEVDNEPVVGIILAGRSLEVIILVVLEQGLPLAHNLCHCRIEMEKTSALLDNFRLLLKPSVRHCDSTISFQEGLC